MKMVLNQNGRTSAVSCRRRREFWQPYSWIFAPTPQWEWHHAGCLHKWLRWDDWVTLFFICRTTICPRVQFGCSAVAGRAGMETKSKMRGRSPRHQKACAGVYFDGFQTQPCQDWLPEQVNWTNCQRDSSRVAQRTSWWLLWRREWHFKITTAAATTTGVPYPTTTSSTSTSTSTSTTTISGTTGTISAGPH